VNFRDTGTMIAQGEKLLAQAFQVAESERLKNSRSPAKMSTAWPEILFSLYDRVGMTADDHRASFNAKQVTEAQRVVDIFSKLDYSSTFKKIALRRARTKETWKKLSERFGYSWAVCRQVSDEIVVHLVMEVQRQGVVTPVRVPEMANEF